MNFRLTGLLLFTASALSAAEPAPWSTYRGNPQRTGNTDGKPGPEKPAVLWAVKSNNHFIASLVPLGETNLYASALAALNRPTITVLPLTGGTKPTWTRTTPYLRLGTVSSPAVSGKYLVFGDGMHQDSGGTLHCLTAGEGQPFWQLEMPGDLIHLEGAPTIANGQVFMGGGGAGVFCVALTQATLDGRDVTAEQIEKLQAAKWKELQDAYEAKVKRDPDSAVPPTVDLLLKPAPKKLWQKGQNQWHVDAPVNVVGGKVLVCTSYLDKEKVGERALYCLDAKTGETLWSAKLAFNPWGGASVSGETVIVAGSSVGLYFNELKGAKGDIAAFELATGKPIWKKDVPAGIVAAVALSSELAITTATDGKVRAFAIKDGERRWMADMKGPLFAPAALGGEVVYIGDLKGVIHALDLKTGLGKWQLDLGADPAVQSPGMIYGGVTLQGGKLYVGTVNLEGPNARKGTCIACIGAK